MIVRPKQQGHSLGQKCLSASGSLDLNRRTEPSVVDLYRRRKPSHIDTSVHSSSSAAATRTCMPCCTDAANSRVECTLHNEIVRRQPCSHQYALLARLGLVGSASPACPAFLLIPRTATPAKVRLFATTRGLEAAISGHYGERMARRQT